MSTALRPFELLITWSARFRLNHLAVVSEEYITHNHFAYVFGLITIIITHSHGSASVVRATTRVNGETKNLTPPPPRSNPISDSHKSWQRWLRRGPLHLCKSSSQSTQAYRFCACVTLRTKNVLVFFGFLQLARAKGTERILTHNTPKHAVPPKDVPFRGREHKV